MPHYRLIVRLFALVCILSGVTSRAHARVFEITPLGPMTIQQAADAARAGDTIRLSPGVYHQRVVFNKASGTHGKPITLEGPTDAIIDGAVEQAFDWEDASFITKGLYRAPIAKRAWHISADGRSVTQLYYKRVQLSSSHPKDQWPALFHKAPERRDYYGLKGLAMVHDDEQMLYVRFEDYSHPKDKEITVAPKQPIVLIDGVHRIVVRGITIRNGWVATMVRASMGSVVEHCTITQTRHGVWLGANSDRCTVRLNEITNAPLATIDPRGQGGRSWTNWLANKNYGYWDHFGIRFVDTSGGNQIHDNHIYSHWGGVEEASANANTNTGNNIHHNLIDSIADDGLEPEGTGPEVQWHHNHVRNCIVGFRIKPLMAGPTYIYRNLIVNCGEGFRNFQSSATKPYVYVYHNTTDARGAYSSNGVEDDRLENYHYFNNLMVGDLVWRDSKKSHLPNWQADHNVFVSRGRNADDWRKTRKIVLDQGLDQNSRFLDSPKGVFANLDQGDFSLATNSPAAGVAGDLTDLVKRDLPGIGPTASSSDAGALPLGQSMPTVPRDPRAIDDLPIAGTYPGPNATFRRVVEEDQIRRYTGYPLEDLQSETFWGRRANALPMSPEGWRQKQAEQQRIADDAVLGPNLLKDGGFEDHRQGAISEWKLHQSKQTNHQLTISPESIPQLGERSVAKIRIDGAADGLGQMFQRVYFKPGQRYRFSGYIKDDGGQVGMVQIKTFKGSKETARLTSPRSKTEWRKVTIDITDRKVDKLEIIVRFNQTPSAQGKTLSIANFYLGAEQSAR